MNTNDLIRIYMNDPFSLYNAHFYKSALRSKMWQIEIGKRLAKLLNIKSAVDFGCGIGCYLEGMKQAGAMVQGYEYSYNNAKKYMSPEIVNNIAMGDVMSIINAPQCDLSMSIEVAEHILPEKSGCLVDNLTNASKRYILFSAAPKGQGGTGHINERPMEDWIVNFNARGFTVDNHLIKDIRSLFTGLPRNKYMSLIKNQVVLFRRK